ncbi:MAG: phosphodiester glycosidase family protein [Gemmatimonadetes bacterium]|nr:phosphodiester glycosidase family protein [Gemmatimonadota bacterium]
MPSPLPAASRRTVPPAALLLLAACAPAAASREATGTPSLTASPWPISRAAVDSLETQPLAPGVWLHRFTRLAGPWRGALLEVDRSACVTFRAVKGAPTAVGRATTSALLAGLPAADQPLAAVNADFFISTPPGVPVGAMVADGRLLSGPVNRPILAFAADGTPSMGVWQAAGTLALRSGVVPLVTWNRPAPRRLGVVDAAWGQPLDSLVRPTARWLVPLQLPESVGGAPRGRYRVAPLAAAGPSQARGDTLLLTGITPATASLLRDGDTVAVQVALAPTMPREAVGGQPLLLRDSVVVAAVDSAGNAGFRDVNPRTAVGVAAGGRRVLLLVVDGRQPGHSVGIGTRPLAELLRALGARDAINLDGGGSSALVVRARDGTTRVVNKVSDATGERPVANALAVLGSCAASR